MTRPVLTAAHFDAMVEGKKDGSVISARSALATESLWGVKAIAQFMNRSPDTIRRMKARDPTFPVRVRGGALFVTKTEIVVWLQLRHDELPQSG